MKRIKQIKKHIEQLKGQQTLLKEKIKKQEENIVEFNRLLRKHEKAKEIVKLVGLKTQSQLSYHISNITSMALDSIMENPYNLKLDFVERRDKQECDLLFERDGICIKPFDGGGGALDIAAFALRVASWTMQTPRSDNVLILDEPFKNLKGQAANSRMLEMVREISKKLNLQIIMVGDERITREALKEHADLIIEVSIKNKISKINVESLT